MNELTIIRQLDALVALASEQGFEVRHELLDGIGSGICEVRGKRCLFLDISSSPAEQLETIRKTLSLNQK